MNEDKKEVTGLGTSENEEVIGEVGSASLDEKQSLEEINSIENVDMKEEISIEIEELDSFVGADAITTEIVDTPVDNVNETGIEEIIPVEHVRDTMPTEENNIAIEEPESLSFSSKVEEHMGAPLEGFIPVEESFVNETDISTKEEDIESILTSEPLVEEMPVEEMVSSAEVVLEPANSQALKTGLPDIEIENNAEEGMTEDLTMKIPPIPPVGKALENMPSPKRKANKAMIFITIVIGIALLAAIVYFLFNNSKNLFLAAVNKEYGNMINTVSKSTGIGKYSEAKDSTLTTSGTFSLDVKADKATLTPQIAGIAEEISKLDGTYVVGTDYKNKNIVSTLGINYNKKNMVEVNGYGTQKKIYIELKDLFSKYISIPMDDYNTLFEDPNLKIEDAKSLTKTMKNAFLDALDSKDFKKESVETKVGNTSKKTNKISYTITEKNIHKVYEIFLKKLKGDKDFVAIVASYSKQSEKQVKEQIDKQIKDSSTDKILGDNQVILSVYMEGLLNKAIKYEITTISKETYKNIENIISYAKDGEDIYIAMDQNQKSIFVLKYQEITENTDKTLITMDGLTMTIDGIHKDGNATYTYLIKDTGTLAIKGKLIVEEQKQGKAYVGKDTFTLQGEIDGVLVLQVDGINTYKTTIGDKVVVPTNTENNVAWDQLTEKDQNTIFGNLLKNKNFMEFMTHISAYTE